MLGRVPGEGALLGALLGGVPFVCSPSNALFPGTSQHSHRHFWGNSGFLNLVAGGPDCNTTLWTKGEAKQHPMKVLSLRALQKLVGDFFLVICWEFGRNLSREGFCRNPRGIFLNKVPGEFCRGFFGEFFRAFFLGKKRGKNSRQNPRQFSHLLRDKLLRKTFQLDLGHKLELGVMLGSSF